MTTRDNCEKNVVKGGKWAIIQILKRKREYLIMEEKRCYIPVVCHGCGNCSDGAGGFPGEEYIEIPVEYLAESDGFVYVESLTDDTTSGNVVISLSNGMKTRSFCPKPKLHIYISIPVKSGMKIKILSEHATLKHARFYPAV